MYSLYKIFKKEKFDGGHVHTPIAALIGKLAARFAGVPVIIYTVHGFYFHEEMVPLKRYFFIILY